MRIKYIGLEPVTNKFGDWKAGDVKNIPEEIKSFGFINLDDENKPVASFKPMAEKIKNKMETKNKFYNHGRTEK